MKPELHPDCDAYRIAALERAALPVHACAECERWAARLAQREGLLRTLPRVIAPTELDRRSERELEAEGRHARAIRALESLGRVEASAELDRAVEALASGVGMGAAAEFARTEMAQEIERLRRLRDRLEARLLRGIPDAVINGDTEHRLPHLANVSFPYVEGESLIMGIKEVAVSSGSACTSASLEPSYVLKGLGLGDELAHSSIRFSMGRFTTEAEVDFAADRVIHEVTRLREMSPLWEMVQEGIDLSQVKWTAH